ncbi:IS1634 family transposase [Neochlamydia sp. AcF84]|uniref:IS1634 family transposase n=1 Tax=Neochlamydia sp. AcF84 TaxID=2315858 RepID=UPI0014074418|nr:IS1634 family transposase [Neochlamydia sp. AcF84]
MPPPQLTNLTYIYKEVIFLEVISRLMAPSSKLQVYLKQNRFLGTHAIPLHHIYRVLDYLSSFQKEIENLIFLKHVDRFGMRVDVIFYDVTTLYFEGVLPDSLRDFGFSKDAKFGEVQVVVGMLVDQEGRPIALGIFPGNTFESKTLEEALKTLQERFKIQHVMIVADRGINSKLNLKRIKDRDYDYLMGCRLKSLNKSLQKQILDIEKYQTIHESDGNILKYREIEFDNIVEYVEDNNKKQQILKERIICTWSLKRAEKDRKDRERLIHKAMERLDQSTASLESKKGANRYLKNEKKQASSLGLDLEKINEDKQWDGFYGIQVSKQSMKKEEILSSYHRLWKMEESFRVMKHSLEIRPIYLSSPERIIGHIVLCFLAFVMYRNLEIALIRKGTDHTVEKIREAIGELEASLLEVNGKSILLRTPAKGLSKEILQTLKLKHPGEMVMNER